MKALIDTTPCSLLHFARTTYCLEVGDNEIGISKLIDLADEYPHALVTRAVTSVLLGLRESTLAQWACMGKGLPYIKSGRRCYYRLSDIKAYLENNIVKIPE